jgi:hypothetical protein
MVAGQLSHFARELDATVGQQDLGFGNPAWVEQKLAGGGVAGVILERQT